MAPIAGVGELNALGAFKEGRREWSVFGNVSEEQIPADAIAVAHGLDMWVVADNLRKGAALNAVQIAEILVRDHFGGRGGRKPSNVRPLRRPAG